MCCAAVRLRHSADDLLGPRVLHQPAERAAGHTLGRAVQGGQGDLPPISCSGQPQPKHPACSRSLFPSIRFWPSFSGTHPLSWRSQPRAPAVPPPSWPSASPPANSSHCPLPLVLCVAVVAHPLCSPQAVWPFACGMQALACHIRLFCCATWCPPRHSRWLALCARLPPS